MIDTLLHCGLMLAAGTVGTLLVVGFICTLPQILTVLVIAIRDRWGR
jgi:hypothetical protein